MPTNMQIQFPDDFPLHGIERDAFEARLRDALHYVLNGHRLKQLADQIDARRTFQPAEPLPLRRIGEEHAFEECMSLDNCRIEYMSAALRRKVLLAVGERLGLSLTAPGLTPYAAKLEQVGDLHEPVAPPSSTTNESVLKPSVDSKPGPSLALVGVLVALGAAMTITGENVWKFLHPSPVPLVATVVSTSSPAQTLRDLATSVPDDRHQYRVSVQVETQVPPPASRSTLVPTP